MATRKKEKSEEAKGTPDEGPGHREDAERERPPLVAGIGASAGGLDALKAFLGALEPDLDLAFVVVSHQAAGRKSLLPEILERASAVPVVEISDGMELQPGCAHIAPPGVAIALSDNTFYVLEEAEASAGHLPIDAFFRSLANNQAERAVGIILSGTGSDGTLGLKAIRARGGMTMVEDPAEAAYGAMPQAAIDAGAVDVVLPTRELPAAVVRYAETSERLPLQEAALPRKLLPKVLVLLRDQTGHDFAEYKEGTVCRRIARRMAVRQLPELDDYLRDLQRNPDEVQALFSELLITVTSFFRDPAAFAALREVLRERVERVEVGAELRVWVPACATGEEAYSVAMLLKELAQELGRSPIIQVFGTDLDERAIQIARQGVYPEGVRHDVEAERLRRFFTAHSGGYRVSADVRDAVIFARQSVIADPPFSRLDLISCRNLLIYLKPSTQRKVVPMFHYALREQGVLFLGTSESVGGFERLFRPLDEKNRIFERQAVGERAPQVDFPPAAGPRREVSAGARGGREDLGTVSVRVRQLLLDLFAPSVVIDDKGGAVYFHGDTGPYLKPAAGEPSTNVLSMAREGLRLPLSAALRQAAAQDEPVVAPSVEVKGHGHVVRVDVSVRKVEESAGLPGTYLVSFTPSPPAPDEAQATGGEGEPRRLGELRAELARTKGLLQHVVEERDGSTEELKAMNEELQSTNEELQSTNEELATSKEETQSLNEELQTVNAELESKVEEMARANNDLQNFLDNTDIATLFLSKELKVRRFTRAATEVVRLIPGDVGRPLADLKSDLEDVDLSERAERVLRTLKTETAKVRSTDGSWYLMRLRPYRTADNWIDGVVITFVDISELADKERALRVAETVIEAAREPLAVLDEERRITSANQSFCAVLGVEQREIVGQSIYEIAGGAWDVPQVRSLLEDILPKTPVFEGFELTTDRLGAGATRVRIDARRLQPDPGLPGLTLLGIATLDERTGT